VKDGSYRSRVINIMYTVFPCLNTGLHSLLCFSVIPFWQDVFASEDKAAFQWSYSGK
jgi:hypothetical protein